MSLLTSRKTSILILTVIYFTFLSFITLIESRSSHENYDLKHSYSNLRRSHQQRSYEEESSRKRLYASEMRGRSLDQIPMSNEGAHDSHDSSRPRRTNTRWNGKQLNLPNISLAASNLQKIRKNYSCKKPRPRLVKVKEKYHVYDKTYVPGCTLLYKCDDEAGCCENDAMQCSPKMQEAVTIFFYVLNYNETKYTGVEPLIFTNDTECECREVKPHPRTFEQERVNSEPEKLAHGVSNLTDSGLSLTYFMPADTSSVNVGTTSTTTIATTITTSATTQQPVAPRNQQLHSKEEQSDELNAVAQGKVLETSKKDKSVSKKSECVHIRCPHPFQASKMAENPFLRCTCDCSEDYDFTRCLAIKKGLHKLSHKERRCVQQGLCLEPKCEFPGHYDTISGICPKEMIDEDSYDKKIHSIHPREIHPRDRK